MTELWISKYNVDDWFMDRSDRFWSSMIACNVSAKEFVFNQSITGGHLENDKMAKIAYLSD